MERKYKHKGYSDRDREEKKRDRPAEPRPRQEQMGPRTPRMVGTVMRARCSNCGNILAPGFDQKGQCPKCHSELHCCKQCVHFDTGAQFECTQPIPERIARKDAKNECTFFEFRMTVEKDTSPVAYATSQSPAPASNGRPDDARKAFEDLFKK
ncbi:MAG: hypothetical protein WAL82_05610 [Candidatus Acidiferrales bacterium]